MKILLIPSWYPTAKTPTKGVFFKEQAQALKKEGHKVIIADFHELWSVRDILRPKDDTSGVTVNEENGLFVYRYKGYDYFPRIYSFKKYIFNYRLKAIYDKIEKDHGKPDLIHAHASLFGGYASTFLKNKLNIPLILTEHATAIGRNLVKKEYVAQLKLALNCADRIIAVGPELKKSLSNFVIADKISVIPNCINVEHFISHEKKKNTLDSRPFRFFSLALLSAIKGIDVLLASFSQLENSNAELIIGGYGDQRNNLELLAKDLGISDRVSFLGELNRDQVVEQMNNCDAFVLPSRYETFGVVYIEALACGKPIIATDCGGPAIIVNDNNGYLVPVDDIQALSESMANMIRDYQKFEPKEIRQDCIDRFSEKAVIHQIQKVYNEVLGAN